MIKSAEHALIDRRSTWLGTADRSARHVRGGIYRAVDDAAREDKQQRLRHQSRDRLDQLVRLTDEMLGELEMENLRGVRRVSPAWRPRLMLLRSSLPFRLAPTGSLRTPTEILDLIFEAQDGLLALRRSVRRS